MGKRAMETMLTIRIPAKLRSDLERLSREDGIPLSALVRRSLTRYLLLERFERARAASLPYARAAGYVTDEDILTLDS
jgi:hypothetical protein